MLLKSFWTGGRKGTPKGVDETHQWLFAYFIIIFLLNSSIVRSDNELGLLWSNKESEYRKTGLMIYTTKNVIFNFSKNCTTCLKELYFETKIRYISNRKISDLKASENRSTFKWK